MDAPRRLTFVAVALFGACVAVTQAGPAATPDPAVLQARYDAGRDAEERAFARGDLAAATRAHRDVAWAEGYDTRPAGWRGGRDVPRFSAPRIARAERGSDVQVATGLARLGRSYGGWAAFWYHDLRTGSWAGWNAGAKFPAASTVKLGVIAAALRRWPQPERSPVWYDLRQLAGWSSNLAANRIVRKLGGERVVQAALRRLGAYASTYPGPYRAGTAAVADAPKPPPHGHWRVTTAHDLGRMLYALQAAAAGNRYVQRQTGLSRRAAELGLALLVDAHPTGAHAGLVRPYVRGTVARKEGWLSDMRGTAAIVYGASPRIVVVLTYRPRLTLAESRTLARRALAIVD
jgi:beta-lactamase class A